MINEVNVAGSEAEASKCSFSRTEPLALFDYADDVVDRKRESGRKG
ncbi:hypothetical protein [Amycolatopsis pretoriensis]|nr:hypothetical protein [Amycolatopsis pretoriensis]